MSYYLRNKHGILIAEIDNSTAGDAIRNSNGAWEEKQFLGTPKAQTIFVFRENMVLSSLVRGYVLKLFIWDGYYLTPTNEPTHHEESPT